MFLRQIFELVKEGEEWCIRNNRELDELIDGEDIVGLINCMRISWLGHVLLVEDDRIPKVILRGTLNGQRRLGRPRRRWVQDVKDDLRRMGTGIGGD